jgi:hypothetical protein
VRIVFDENTPPAVARAIRELASALNVGVPDPVEVLHARDLVAQGTHDVPLIQAVADGTHAKSALITCDKSIRTRAYEHAAFVDTGCIGIILLQHWNHASMMDRARLSVLWWETWVQTVVEAKPGSLWQCPWHSRPKRLAAFEPPAARRRQRR